MAHGAAGNLLSNGRRSSLVRQFAAAVGLLDSPPKACDTNSAESSQTARLPRPRRIATRPHLQRLFVWLLVICLAIIAAMALPMIAGRVYTADDLGAFHLPIRAFYAHCLAAGNAFDWIPQLYSGFFLTGDGQLGGYHPLHCLLYRCLPLAIAFDLECLISYPALLLGTYCFLRQWRLPRYAALFGGMASAFCGFSMLHFVHVNAVAVVAHLPWLLMATDALVRNRSAKARRRRVFAGAAVALLTGSQLLLGYPQYVCYSLLAMLGYGLLVCSSSPVRPENANGTAALASPPFQMQMRPLMFRPLILMFWIALGFAVAAVQLLPTYEALAESARQSADAAFRNSGSLHPLNLIQLVAPYLFRTRVVGQNTHELGCYAGAVSLLLAVWAIVGQKRRRNRTLIWGAAALAIVGFAIAMGEFGPLAGVTAWLPVVNRMRFPCRAIVLVHFAIAILAAVGLMELCRAREPNRAGLRAIWALAICSVAIAIVGPLLWASYTAAWPLVWIGPAITTSSATLMTFSTRGVRWARFALVLFAAADLATYGLTNSFYSQTLPLQQFAAATPAPPGPAIGRVAVDLAAPNPRVLHAGDRLLLSGWNLADGYAGLEPARTLDNHQIAALRAAGVIWVSANANVADADSKARGPSLPGWTRVTGSLPRAKLFAEAKASTDPADDISQIDLESTLLVEQPIQLDSGRAGTVAVVEDRPGRIRLQTEAPAERLLFVSESFHPGWKCWVDGRPAPVLRVDGDFLGCLLRGGTRQVGFEFLPDSVRYGRLLSAFGLGLLGGIVLLHGLLGWHARGFAWACRPRILR